MRKLLIAILLVILILPTLAQDDGFALTILHTDTVYDENSSDDGVGGVAKEFTIFEEIRSSTDNVLILDGGDRFLNPTHYVGNAEIMNTLRYDAMTIGNHEFNGGDEVLAEFIGLLEFPVVIANIDFSVSPFLADSTVPYIVVDRSGEQIGIIGLAEENAQILSSPGPELVFLEDETQVTQDAVNALIEMGVNKIVVISHNEALENTVLASAVTGVDIIIGGSDDVLLSNSDDEAEFPYPIETESLSGEPVLIVQTSEGNEYLGQLDVVFDADGVLAEWGGDNIYLDESIEENADIASMVEAIEVLQAGVVMGNTDEALVGGDPCREEECHLGNLITDAIREAMFTDIAVYNSGGIRADIDAGDITAGEIVAVLPFGNVISTLELTGVDVVAMLEHSVSLGGDASVGGSGRFLQVSGMRFSWNPTRPVGSRIESVEVEVGDGAFEALDPNAIYSIATNDFIRNGGDDYVTLSANAIDPFDFGPPVDIIVADYINANSPISVELEGRITRLGD